MEISWIHNPMKKNEAEFVDNEKSKNRTIKRDAKTGRFIAVTAARSTTKSVLKESASRNSAALTRLANR